MILEVRTSKGDIIADYKGEFALVQFGKLMAARDLFKLATKRLGNVGETKSEEYPCFVALVDSNLQITENFTLHIHQHDYVKVIR